MLWQSFSWFSCWWVRWMGWYCWADGFLVRSCQGVAVGLGGSPKPFLLFFRSFCSRCLRRPFIFSLRYGIWGMKSSAKDVVVLAEFLFSGSRMGCHVVKE